MASDAEIGRRIRAAREAANRTLRELADHAGVEITRLSRMETGERNIPANTLAALARAMGMTVSQLPGADIAEASGHYAADYPVRQILADYEASGGLRDLPAALGITPEEWRMRAQIAKARGHYAADHPVRQIRADLRGAARPAGIWPPPGASPPSRSAGSRLGLRPTILLRCGQSQFMI